MDNQNDKLKILVQAGAIGLCILLIALVYVMFTKYADLVEQNQNVFRENTKALQRLNNLLENPMSANVLKELSLNNLLKYYEKKN